MLEIKLKSQKILEKKQIKLFLSNASDFILLFCAVLCLFYPVGAFIFSPASFIEKTDKNIFFTFLTLSSFCAVFLFVFFFMRRFYNLTKISYYFDKNTVRPENVYNFKNAFRFAGLKMLLIFHKTLWAAFFFSPSFITIAFVIFSIRINGQMIKSNFFTLCILSAVLFLTGLAFYFAVSGRYYLCEYILCTNPITAPSRAVSSSVFLAKGKLMKILRMRLSLLPWKLLSLSIVGLPFGSLYVKCLKFGICESVYGEKKYNREKPAVVFYINANTKIIPY